MPEFDSRRINSMRQDAIRRSQEMHSRAVRGNAPEGTVNGITELKTQTQGKNAAGLLSEITGSLDGDKLLIAALLLLLMREGGDIRLILALGYILL